MSSYMAGPGIALVDWCPNTKSAAARWHWLFGLSPAKPKHPPWLRVVVGSNHGSVRQPGRCFASSSFFHSQPLSHFARLAISSLTPPAISCSPAGPAVRGSPRRRTNIHPPSFARPRMGSPHTPLLGWRLVLGQDAPPCAVRSAQYLQTSVCLISIYSHYPPSLRYRLNLFSPSSISISIITYN